MARCGACMGSGKVRCPTCSGRGYTTRLTINGEMDMSTCGVCAGRRQIACTFCGGRGSITVPGEGPERPAADAPPRDPANPLAGRWQADDGEWYEFRKTAAGFHVVTGNADGQTGEGTASLRGSRVAVRVNVVLWGTFDLQFELSDDCLGGTFDIMGVRVSKTYIRT